jgi:hypothetical protein
MLIKLLTTVISLSLWIFALSNTPYASGLTLLKLPENHPDAAKTSSNDNSVNSSGTSSTNDSSILSPSQLNNPNKKSMVAQSLRATFNYYGGPVIPNVEVFVIFYGSNVRFQNEMIDYYKFLPDSVHMDWCMDLLSSSCFF